MNRPGTMKPRDIEARRDRIIKRLRARLDALPNVSKLFGVFVGALRRDLDYGFPHMLRGVHIGVQALRVLHSQRSGE